MTAYIKPYALFVGVMAVAMMARTVVCRERWTGSDIWVRAVLVFIFPLMLLTHARLSLVVAFRIAAVVLAIVGLLHSTPGTLAPLFPARVAIVESAPRIR